MRAQLPLLAGSMVVTQEASGIVARSVANGEEKLHGIDEEGNRLVGADGAGNVTAIAISTGPAASPRGRLVVARGDDIE